MKKADMFPTRFVSADDVKKLGDGVPMVIKRVERETGINPRTKKESDLYVVYFLNARKGVRIRKSQSEFLFKYLGEDTTLWAGKEVTLYTENTRVGPGARIHPKGAPTAESAKEDMSHE